jgi:hypothetical protein
MNEADAIKEKISSLGIQLPGGQAGIALEYFLERPNKDVEHDDVVPWIEGMYQKRFHKVCKDPDRAIRKLHDIGILQKIGSKGVYRLDPDAIVNTDLEDFDEQTKVQVKNRDGGKCVVCGLGEKDGVEIQVDHILPRSKGGSGNFENGQTLCGAHNYRKKKLGQIEFGDRMFVQLRRNAKSTSSDSNQADLIIQFCDEVLAVFEKYGFRSDKS